MTDRENILRTIRFEEPDRIPMVFSINQACWHHYDQNTLQDLMEEHPLLFPGYVRQEKVVPVYGLCSRKDEPYTDPWGCVWETTDDGITGVVKHHPLADWSSFEGFQAPDPNTTDGTYPMDWKAILEQNTPESIRAAKEAGQLSWYGLSHGHTFLRLQDIRGYENLLYDMEDEDPRLYKLIDMVSDFNYGYILNCMKLQPDIVGYPEDLGMQVGPMLSPENFRKYIKPVFKRMMQPARDAGCIVHMHSDGDIRSLVYDLIDGGVDVINLQDIVNGIDWIAERFAGNTCIDLDIDRQQITPFGTADQIDALIREEVEKLGSKRGGLMMVYGMYPGVPIENAKALMDAMERYSTYYS